MHESSDDDAKLPQKTCLLAAQEDMFSCCAGGNVCLLHVTCLLVDHETMSSC